MVVDVKGCIAVALALSIGLAGTFVCASEYRASDVQKAVKDLSSRDEEIRHSAAYHLSEMGPEAKDAVPQLIEVLQSDPVISIRAEAASALGKIGAPASAAIPGLISFLKSKEGKYERTYAASALGGIGKQPELAVPALIDALQHDEEPVVKRLAAMALGSFGADARPAIPALIEALNEGNKDLREAAAYGLRKIPAGASDVPALTKLLDDDIDIAREAAARSIAGAGSEAVGAVPKLVALLEDKNASVREAAAGALGAIGPDAKEAVPALKKALTDAEVHDEAADALEQIKKRRH
ncbi:MAG: glycosyltransferase [Candidatus Melainabacteria bacterium]|nr:MAG: glycosyltransferase [Candidatus Melainabacteria bacterium]